MAGRTFRHVISTRFNQKMVGNAGRLSRASTGTSAGEATLISLSSFNTYLARLLLTVALIMALFPGTVSVTALDSCLSTVPIPTPVTAVHVQPDVGYQPVLDEINFARCSIDLSMYLLTDQVIIDALDHAIERGLRVRVILEKSPFGTYGDQQEMFERLNALGAEVRWSPDVFEFGHAKYMIADGSVVIITNQNFTVAGFNRNREFGVVSTEDRYVSEAKSVFEADWTGSRLDREIEYLVVSPVNSRDTVLDLIENSVETVWMYSEVLRDEGVTDALNRAADRGVDVRILVNPSADEDDVPYFLDALGRGVQIRILMNPYVHSKVMLVDGNRALVGSQNYSYTSLELNRELGLILDDAINVDIIASIYERDWSRAVPVDTITKSDGAVPVTLTQLESVGRITCGRWRVV